MTNYIQTVRKRQANGEVKDHFYLRPPAHLRHVLGTRVRLPGDAEQASAYAEKLLYQSIREIPAFDQRLLAFAKKAHDNAFARANKRGWAYELSRNKIIEMMERQRYVCAVSGMPFSLEWSNGRNPFAPSLDRVENSLGYTIDNTRLVLAAVNYGLNVWGLEIYAAVCAAVAMKQNTKATLDVNRFLESVNGPFRPSPNGAK